MENKGMETTSAMMVDDISSLQLYLDYEIVKLLYLMNSGEDLDISAVDQNGRESAISALRKISKIGRSVVAFSIQGPDLLQYSGNIAKCMPGHLAKDLEDIMNELTEGPPGSGTTEAPVKVFNKESLLDSKSMQWESKGTQTDLVGDGSGALKGTKVNDIHESASSSKDKIEIEVNVGKSVERAVVIPENIPSTTIGGTSEQPDFDSNVHVVEQIEKEKTCPNERLDIGKHFEVENAKDKSKLQSEKEHILGADDVISKKVTISKVKKETLSEDVAGLNKPTVTRTGRKVKPPAHFGASVVDSRTDYLDENLGQTEDNTRTCDVVRRRNVRGAGRKKAFAKDGSAVSVSSGEVEQQKKIKKRKQQCPTCGKLVNSLEQHQQTHNIPSHACQICKQKFSLYHNCQRHIATVHQREFPFSCEKCGKGFSWRRLLLEHKYLIHGVGSPEGDSYFPRKHACDICGRTFKTFQYLTSHKNAVHEKKRPFKCNTCEKSFTKQYHLQMHQRTHTGEKPYLCSFCGKGFADKGNMDVHVRGVHLRLLQYKCNICNVEFRRKKQLIEHQRLGHTEDGKPISSRGTLITLKKTCPETKRTNMKKQYQVVRLQTSEGTNVTNFGTFQDPDQTPVLIDGKPSLIVKTELPVPDTNDVYVNVQLVKESTCVPKSDIEDTMRTLSETFLNAVKKENEAQAFVSQSIESVVQPIVQPVYTCIAQDGVLQPEQLKTGQLPNPQFESVPGTSKVVDLTDKLPEAVVRNLLTTQTVQAEVPTCTPEEQPPILVTPEDGSQPYFVLQGENGQYNVFQFVSQAPTEGTESVPQ